MFAASVAFKLQECSRSPPRFLHICVIVESVFVTSSREVKPSTPSVCVLSKPDSRISTSRDATTVLTTLGICIVLPSDSLRFLVPYATSWRNDVLEIKSKKWSTLTGSRRHRCKTGGSITWPGLLGFACFLASSILHYYLIVGYCLVILF